jgi:hypothetical protein
MAKNAPALINVDEIFIVASKNWVGRFVLKVDFRLIRSREK